MKKTLLVASFLSLLSTHAMAGLTTENSASFVYDTNANALIGIAPQGSSLLTNVVSFSNDGIPNFGDYTNCAGQSVSSSALNAPGTVQDCVFSNSVTTSGTLAQRLVSDTNVFSGSLTTGSSSFVDLTKTTVTGAFKTGTSSQALSIASTFGGLIQTGTGSTFYYENSNQYTSSSGYALSVGSNGQFYGFGGLIQNTGSGGGIDVSSAYVSATAPVSLMGIVSKVASSSYTGLNCGSAYAVIVGFLTNGQISCSNLVPAYFGPEIVLGHTGYQGTIPTVTSGSSACGTSASVITGSTDSAGRVTVGTSTNGGTCPITFAKAFLSKPSCVANNETTANLVRAIPTTTGVSLNGTLTAGDIISWNCQGLPN